MFAKPSSLACVRSGVLVRNFRSPRIGEDPDQQHQGNEMAQNQRSYNSDLSRLFWILMDIFAVSGWHVLPET